MSHRHSNTRTTVARAAPPIPVASFHSDGINARVSPAVDRGTPCPREDPRPPTTLAPPPSAVKNNRSIFCRVTASWNLLDWKYHPAQVRTCDLRVHTESSELQYKHESSTAPPLSFMCSFPVWVCMHACPQSKLYRHDVKPSTSPSPLVRLLACEL